MKRPQVKLEPRSYQLRHPDEAHQLRARMWRSAHPEAVTRVAQLIGGDEEMAAFMLAGHDGTVDSLCQHLEETLLRLAGEMVDKARKQHPNCTVQLKDVSITLTRQ